MMSDVRKPALVLSSAYRRAYEHRWWRSQVRAEQEEERQGTSRLVEEERGEYGGFMCIPHFEQESPGTIVSALPVSTMREKRRGGEPIQTSTE